MVVTSPPSAWAASTVHDFTDIPSSSTVHAPQLEVSQPTWVPVSRRFSRRWCTSSVRASTSTAEATPFTVSRTSTVGLGAGMSMGRSSCHSARGAAAPRARNGPLIPCRPMIRHVLCFRWNEGTTTEQVDELAAALRALPSKIPEIRSFTCGPDVGVNEGNWHFAVVAEFDDIADQTTYRDHPEHVRV